MPSPDTMRLCVNQREWVGHRTLCREVVISLVLEAVEPIRVGAGRGEVLTSPIDLPVYRQRVCRGRNCEYLPVIPGSSLKGVLRTVSAAIVGACGLPGHTGLTRYGDDCVNELLGGPSNFDRLRSALYREGKSEALKDILAGFCPTCLLYGAPSYAAKLTVGDFTPVPDTISIGVKTCAGINRRTGAPAKDVLYTVEFVEPGSRFEGLLYARNTPNWMLSLLAASILALHRGYAKIGGFKSRGMGRVQLVVNNNTPLLYV